VEFASQGALAFAFGGTERDHRDATQRLGLPNLAKDREAVGARHVEVEEDHVGQRIAAARLELAVAEEVVERFLPTARGAHRVSQAAALQRLEGALEIGLIIVDQQDANFRFHGLSP